MNVSTSLVLLLFALSACSGEKSATEYLEAAQSHMATGELQAALIEGRNAIRLDTENSVSRALVGELELLVGSPTNSEKELLRAIELGTPEAEVTHLLSRVFLIQGKHEEIMGLATSDLSSDHASEVLANQASSTLYQGNIPEATDLAQKSLELNAESPTALTVNARLNAVGHDFAEAKALLKQALDKSETHAEAWELLGDIESMEQKLTEAVASYSKAVESASNKLPLILKRAQANLRMKDYAAVTTDLESMKGASAKLPAVSLIKSEMLFSEGKFLEAQTELEEGLKVSPESPALARSMALTHLMLGNYGQAEQYGKQYQASVNSDDSLVLQAAIRLQQGRAELAEQTLQPLLEANRLDALGSRILATSFLMQEKSDEAIVTMIDLYNRLNQAAVADMPDLALLAGPATVLSQELLDIAPSSDDTQIDDYLSAENMSLVTAVTHLLSGQTEDAREELENLAKLSPGNPAISGMNGRINLVNNDLLAARASFQGSSGGNGESTSAAMFLALLDINDKNNESAKIRLTDALDNAEGMMRERVLMMLANLESSSGNTNEMVNWLQQAKEENERAYLPSIELANHQFQSRNPQAVIDTLSSLTTFGKSNPQTVKLMAQAYLALEQFDEAKDLIDPFVSQNPDNPEWRYLRAGASAGLGDLATVIDDLDAALKANPDHAPSLVAKTNLDIRANRLEVAEVQLARLESLVPGAPALTSIRERLNERTSGSTSAPPESTEDVMQAAKALWSDNEQDEAVSLMKDWVEKNPDDISVLLTLGNTYTTLEKQDEAIAMFESVLQVSPTNFIALNNLAWQLRDRDPSAAVSHVSAALQQQPDSVATLDTLAVIHYKLGNYAEAEKAFQKIQSLEPSDPTILFHGAQIEIALGNAQAARDLLEPLVSGDVEFPEAAEAKALLDGL